jgi:formiminotetrahydrofolate cyclodeaminase
VKEFDAWLNDLSTKASPGGVAAAAAAMGAALLAKAVRVTLKRQPVAEPDRILLQSALGLAQVQTAILLDLSAADERAFRAVLDLQEQEAGSLAGRLVWLAATEVPVRVAEACHSLLTGLPDLVRLCWPAVYPDLKTGGWLLEVGVQAGLLSAQSNLSALGDGAQARSLRARMVGLTQSDRDD